MYWKMSIDLARPLVPSMGQHDPLDGYVTYAQLRSTASSLLESASGPTLENETKQFAAMVKVGDWTTADPLGIGGLLVDAYRVGQLIRQGAPINQRLLETLLTASLAGLQYYTRSGELRLPAEYRLAFRELGLAIGLRAAVRMRRATDRDSFHYVADTRVREGLQALAKYAPIGDEIKSFWRDPDHRRARTWSEHRDINEVMLATSLAPEGFLVLGK